MPKLLTAIVCCAAGMLAAQELWDGQAASVRFQGPELADRKVAVAPDGTLTVSGRNTGSARYSYLTFSIRTKPFSMKGKSLAVTVSSANSFPGDSLYIKGRNAAGKYVLSAYNWQIPTTRPTVCTVTPGGGGSLQWIADQIAASPDDPVTTLEIHYGRRKLDTEMKIHIRDIRLIDRPRVLTTEGMRDLGIGVDSSELRNCVAGRDAKGRPFILACPLDAGAADYLLYTEVDTGKTFQYVIPGITGGAIYGAALTDGGKFVFGLCGRGVIFDVNTRKFTVVPQGSSGAHLCCAIAPNGKVYLGCTPNARLFEADPETGIFRDLGPADPREHYLNLLAVDKNNFVYCGIGTARANIVAVDPRTGKKTQLLPEELRKTGSATVIAGQDGYVYVSFRNFRAKCLDGKIVAKDVSCPAPARPRTLKYGTRLGDLGNGMRMTKYDMVERKIHIQYADGRKEVLPVVYRSGGLDLTSLAAGPDGKVYVSSAHPHHLVRLDPATDKLTDLGFNPIVSGGNFCDMQASNGKLYAGEYVGGRMWEYDPALPVAFKGGMRSHADFGVPLADLARNGRGSGGRWSMLDSMNLLLGIGEAETNLLTLDLPVPADGRYYLNIQFYKSGAYGTVRMTAGGRHTGIDLQSDTPGVTPIRSFGPFELKKGTFPVWFTISANNNPASRRFFSITAAELAAEPRKDNGAAKIETIRANPRIVGQWPDLVTRPRTIAAHPNGRDVVVAGFANYGLTGGGFGVYDRATGKTRAIDKWLPGESCIALAWLPTGDMVGGTSIEAPGGGHLLAKEATVFRMKWPEGKIVKTRKLVDCTNVFSVEVFGDTVLAATGTGRLLVLTPDLETIADYDISEGGAVLRNALLAYGGRYFLLQRERISELDAKDRFRPIPLAKPLKPITGGGAAVDGKLYFIANSTNVHAWAIPPVTKR